MKRIRRVPAGVPSGGQFSLTPRDESALSLDPPFSEVQHGSAEPPRGVDPEWFARLQAHQQRDLVDEGAIYVQDAGGDVVPVRPGVLDDDSDWVYTNGQCLALAVAMSERTGWPVVVTRDDLDDTDMDGEPFYSLRHAYVQAPDGTLLDIRGEQGSLRDVVDADEQFAFDPEEARLAQTFFHATTARLQPGDVVRPGAEVGRKNFGEGADDSVVYMTEHPSTAYDWGIQGSARGKKAVRVYEVRAENAASTGNYGDEHTAGTAVVVADVTEDGSAWERAEDAKRARLAMPPGPLTFTDPHAALDHFDGYIVEQDLTVAETFAAKVIAQYKAGAYRWDAAFDYAALDPSDARALLDRDLDRRYTQGDCGVLAHYLATQNGWGVCVVGEYEEEDWGLDEPSYGVDHLMHAYAVRPDGMLVDIRGVHDPQQILTPAGMHSNFGAVYSAHTYPDAASADRIWNHEQWLDGERWDDSYVEEDERELAEHVARLVTIAYGTTAPPADG